VVTGGWITPADRVRWQRRAAGELAAILAAHPDVPMIAWTVTASGGSLSGQVLGPAETRRGLFSAWQQVLRLGEVTETASASGAAFYLHARAMRDGVAVSVTATVFPAGEVTG
jgi:hypothetical protein